jgi:hypothetical protein
MTGAIFQTAARPLTERQEDPMGFITTRLNGKTQRSRRRPVAASIQAVPAADERHKDNAVVAEIGVRGPSGDYYEILMTQEDLDQLITNLAPASSIKTRIEIAAASLHGLDDSQLLSLICEVLHGRERPSGVLKP